MTVASIDDYLAALPGPARTVMEELRRTVHAVVPDVGETIRYGMPTFTLDGGSLVHLAAWKNHIGFYPLPPLDGELAAEAEPYRGAKDAMRLPLRGPVPYDLVGRVVAVLAERHRADGAAAESPVSGSAEQPGSQQDENDPGTSDG